MKKLIAMIMTAAMMLGLGTAALAATPLTAEQARQAALDYTGVSVSQAVFTKVCRDYDDGREVYEIEFYADDTEYDMDIDVNTGRITDFSTEYHGVQTYREHGAWDDDFDDLFDLDDDWDKPWDFD
ncbi:MAG: PepSY domain-containing protein [Oscillospiraceae bacterium]|jgi:archaellin|nr:PepSY domain-containing protein [Oscillospiraceae bacterium]